MEAVKNLNPEKRSEKLSVVIPTYRREKVLIETLEHLQALNPGPTEILVIDQSPTHEESTLDRLSTFERGGVIRLIKLEKASITGAMNLGLQLAGCDIVLFLDDDIVPHADLIEAHLEAHREGRRIVAGQVLQPGEMPLHDVEPFGPFRFNSTRKQFHTEFIGCNFSVNRQFALGLGGFDENFVQVAYRYEAEFADRALTAGEQILFEPRASIKHLKAGSGGTRSFGEHLTTVRPGHAVGAYYFLLRSKKVPHRFANLIKRPLRAIRTKHHLKQPWWIPATLTAEAMGFAWALFLYLRGPRRLGPIADNKDL